MATKKVEKAVLAEIDTTALGEYNSSDYTDKLYGTVYYSIRELQGLSTKRSLGEEFSWDELKLRFEATFGKADERRYTLEQLLAYAQKKFGKTLEQLLEINEKSWSRRRRF